MKRSQKQARNLQSRLQDHTAMLAKGSKENKVQLRLDTGGFHRPGSNKK